MSFQALLFCQDEKTARTVTQVLSELDFNVDTCAETFAAVKKLTSQAFEAVVVDCQSEENAGLLLKTARNSASNQASLMVALVEGQAGVAAAFRIGANLVLTKPIAIEQARSTLRVARGLLRKNTVAAPAVPSTPAPAAVAKPAAPKPAPVSPEKVSARVPAAPAAPAAPPTPPPARIPTPSAPVAARPVPPQFPAAPRAVPFTPSPASAPAHLKAAASSPNVSFGKLETESEHQPQPDAASAGLLEALDFKTFEAAPANPFHTAPAETEIVSVMEISAATPGAVQPVFTAPTASAMREGSFGAAVAPARDLHAPGTHTAPDPIAVHHEPEVASKFDITDSAPHAPEIHIGEKRAASGSKTPLIAGVIFVAVAAAIYFGWSQMHKPAPATAAVAAIQPPAPDYPTPGTTTTADTTTPAPVHGSTADVFHAANPPQAAAEPVNRFSRQPRAVAPVAEDRVTTPAPVPAHTAAPAHTAVATPTQSAPTSAPIQVKTQLQHAQQPSTVKAAATQDAPEPPPISNLGATARPDALNTIARSTPAALPAIATPHNISQGVSAGLLVKKVQPVYPSQALQMHIQGNVSLIATIAKDGSIKDVKVVSGPAPLVRAATDAVRQWKYRPYTLNGEPVEIQTEININFVPPR